MPVEPAVSPWQLPGLGEMDPDDDLVAIGADLEPGTLLAAYRQGLFPMPIGRPHDPPYWFCPVRRGVLELADLRVTRSLRRACPTYEIRVDTACAEVIDACADPTRPDGWIDADIRAAYLRLHDLGWVHSVEAWRDGRLAGGLYGVAIGGLFAGESMFHRERDASKVALVGLVDLLHQAPGDRLVDVQWRTDHLATLGVSETSRTDYAARLAGVLGVALPPAFDSTQQA